MRNIQQMAGKPFKEARLRTMSAAAKEKLTTFNEAQVDWDATCRKCGQKLTGSLEDMRNHQCRGDGA